MIVNAFKQLCDGRHRIPLTVKHILVECPNLRDIREKYFTVSSITDLFKTFSALTPLVGRQEGHPAHKNMGGKGGHWLVRMEWRQPDDQCVCLC